MANYIKGNIMYQPVVEQINRKFVPVKQTCSASKALGPVKMQAKGWMGGGTRTTFRGEIGTVSKNYLIIRANSRGTIATPDELVLRNNFARATKGAAHILQDLSQISRVQILFTTASKDSTKTINGVSAAGYTMRGWVMAVQYAGVKEDVQYNENTFPANFDA